MCTLIIRYPDASEVNAESPSFWGTCFFSVSPMGGFWGVDLGLDDITVVLVEIKNARE